MTDDWTFLRHDCTKFRSVSISMRWQVLQWVWQSFSLLWHVEYFIWLISSVCVWTVNNPCISSVTWSDPLSLLLRAACMQHIHPGIIPSDACCFSEFMIYRHDWNLDFTVKRVTDSLFVRLLPCWEAQKSRFAQDRRMNGQADGECYQKPRQAIRSSLAGSSVGPRLHGMIYGGCIIKPLWS